MGISEIFVKIIGFYISFAKILYWYLEALYRQFIPPPMKSIDAEIILVTGATGGIGKELCRYIVKCGVDLKLVLWDLNIDQLNDLADDLKHIGLSGLQVFSYQVDISSKENIDIYCQRVKGEVGAVTILFNNAGIADFTSNFLQLSDSHIEQTIKVNLMSHLWIIRQLLPDMVVGNHGRIVNTCSAGGLKATTHALPYISSKFAVNGYTEALKAELGLFGNDGIFCTTVYPYFIQTPLVKSLTTKKNIFVLLPFMKTLLKPENVARKMVDGMRREYERVYLPSIIPLILLVEYFLPNKVRKFVESSQLRIFAFKDTEEENNYKVSYLDVALGAKSNENLKKDN